MLKNLKIWQKLSLIALVSVIPVFVLLSSLVTEQNKAIELAAQERKGIEYLVAVRQLMQNVQKHRSAASAFLSGDTFFRDEMTNRQAEIETNLQALDTVDKKYGAEFKTSDRVKVLKQKWQDLKSRVSSMSPQDSADAHTRLITTNIIPLILQVSNNSKLILSPDLESYWMMDTIVSKLPDLTETMAQARAYGLNVVSRKTATADQKASLTFLLGRARDGLDKVNGGLQIALEANPSLEPKLRPTIVENVRSTNQYLDTLERRIINITTTIDITDRDYYNISTAGIDSNFKLYDAATPVLDTLLQARIQRLDEERALSFVVVLVSLGGALAVMILVSGNITRALVRVVQVADRISMGELDTRIDIDGKDEVGELAEAISRMQTSLQVAIDRLRARRAV